MWYCPDRPCSASAQNEQIHLNVSLQIFSHFWMEGGSEAQSRPSLQGALSNWHQILVQVLVGSLFVWASRECLINMCMFFYILVSGHFCASCHLISDLWTCFSFLLAFPPCGSCPPRHGHHTGQEQRGQYPCVCQKSTFHLSITLFWSFTSKYQQNKCDDNPGTVSAGWNRRIGVSLLSQPDCQSHIFSFAAKNWTETYSFSFPPSSKKNHKLICPEFMITFTAHLLSFSIACLYSLCVFDNPVQVLFNLSTFCWTPGNNDQCQTGCSKTPNNNDKASFSTVFDIFQTVAHLCILNSYFPQWLTLNWKSHRRYLQVREDVRANGRRCPSFSSNWVSSSTSAPPLHLLPSPARKTTLSSPHCWTLPPIGTVWKSKTSPSIECLRSDV